MKLLIIGAAIVAAIILLIGLTRWLRLRQALLSSTSVAIAYQQPPTGTMGGTYNYRATIIPATIGGAPVTATIQSLTVECHPMVTPGAATTPTAGFTAAIGPTLGGSKRVFARGGAAPVVDLQFDGGANDRSWTRAVAEVDIQSSFTLLGLTFPFSVIYKEYVPGPFPTIGGDAAPNTDLTGIPD